MAEYRIRLEKPNQVGLCEVRVSLDAARRLVAAKKAVAMDPIPEPEPETPAEAPSAPAGAAKAKPGKPGKVKPPEGRTGPENASGG